MSTKIFLIKNFKNSAINLEVSKPHPHTLFVHHIETDVKNLFEEEVTESQIFGRSLLKAFTVAASYAKAKYGVSLYFMHIL